MAEVQKGAAAVTADGADADAALLPIAGRTHAQITLFTVHFSHAHVHRSHCILTDHKALFTCTDAQIR